MAVAAEEAEDVEEMLEVIGVISATAFGSSLAFAKRDPAITIAPTDAKVPKVRRLSTLRTLLDALSLSAICIHSDFSGFDSGLIGDPFR